MLGAFSFSILGRSSQAAEEYLRRGQEYLESHKYDEAIKEFEHAVRARPDSAEAYYQLGLAHWMVPFTDKKKTEHLNAAYKAFSKAVRLKPDLAEAHGRLGVIYMTFGQYDEGVNSLKEAVRLRPDLAEAHKDLGSAYLYKGQYAEAIAPLEEAVKLKPDFAIAHQVLGLAYLTVDQKEKALEQYNILTSLDQKMANYLYSKIQAPEKPTFGVATGKPVSVPQPAYPLGMTQAWSGTVNVEVMVDEDGEVLSAHALNGPSEIRKVCEGAALKARFSPTKVSGTPVKTKGILTYNFVR